MISHQVLRWRSILSQPRTRLFLVALFILALVIAIGRLIENDSYLQNVDPPQWRGIIPNKTNRQEVINILGPPDRAWGCKMVREDLHQDFFQYFDCIFAFLSYDYHEPTASSRPDLVHEIRFKSGRVWTIAEDMLTYPEEKQMSVESLVKRYGQPERVTWSYRSPYYNSLLFCQQGVIAHATSSTVGRLLYFTPMTTEKCLESFSKEIALENPFADSDIIGTEDPWGYNDPTRPVAISRLKFEPHATWEEINDYIDCAFIKTGMTRQEVEEQLSKIGTYKVSEDNSQSTQTVTVKFDEFPLPNRNYRYENDKLVYAARHYELEVSPTPVEVYCWDYIEHQTN